MFNASIPKSTKDSLPVASSKNSAAKEKEKHAIHWVRKDLRLHDNPSLLEAVKGSETLRVIYVLDTKVDRNTGIGLNLWRFLLSLLKMSMIVFENSIPAFLL